MYGEKLISKQKTLDGGMDSIVKGDLKKVKRNEFIGSYIPENYLIYPGRENRCSERIVQNLRNVYGENHFYAGDISWLDGYSIIKGLI